MRLLLGVLAVFVCVFAMCVGAVYLTFGLAFAEPKRATERPVVQERRIEKAPLRAEAILPEVKENLKTDEEKAPKAKLATKNAKASLKREQ